ncbi:MAG: hypothetical protein ACE5I9_03010 [Candidatus Methylomirabilales bacterium]
MRILLNLKPGQKGTKKLLAEYGDRLVCVRYRYDGRTKKRLKTMELIVAERDWEPKRRRLTDETIVGVRIGLQEVELRNRAKRAGGKWNSTKRVWEMRYDRVVGCGLEGRMVEEDGS